jgi:5,10-methylenetetrahydrofolate reductase
MASAPPLLEALRGTEGIVAAELRPPLADLATMEGMEAWIDTYHAVRRLTRAGTYVFLTDSAVGTSEEDNLRHLIANVGMDVARERIVPFLTAKHTRHYCESYAERAAQHGFPALVVLGGDRAVGVPRCVEHAWELRRLIRARVPELELGGWANPNAEAERQVGYLLDGTFTAEFYLTQIVSHHAVAPVEGFLDELDRRGAALPGMFGVFYYRSANPRTLATLAQFLPVPAEALRAEFGAGATPQEVCARTLRALRALGVRHCYISNLPLARADRILTEILELAGEDAAHPVQGVSPTS